MNSTIPSYVPLEVFFPTLTESFPSASSGLLSDVVLRACRELCRISKCIRRTIEVPLYCGEHDYLIVPDECMQVGYLYGGQMCLDGPYIPAGKMYGVRFTPPNIIQLKYAPQEHSSMFLSVSLVPKLDACEVPEVLYDLYHDTVISGATMLLAKMPNKKWTDYGLYQLSKQEFDAGVASAGVDRILNFKLGPHKLKLGV